jgi:hypothetical protein
MSTASRSTFHPGRWIAAILVLALVAACAAVLLASVAAALPIADLAPADDPRLAPFRWVPLARGLA